MMELKPCPFCGEKVFIHHHEDACDGKWHVHCEGCDLGRNLPDTEEAVAERWNTRHTSPEVAALVEACRAHLFSDSTHAALESALFQFIQEANDGRD